MLKLFLACPLSITTMPNRRWGDGATVLDATRRRFAVDHQKLIDDYLAGPGKLRAAVAGLTEEEINSAPVPGKWSTRQVVCHIADFEPVYADRMKRVIAEE